MKNYNKLPFKERKRHLQYQFDQTERQEEILIKKEIDRMRLEKIAAHGSEEPISEKDREMKEQARLFCELMKGGNDESKN